MSDISAPLVSNPALALKTWLSTTFSKALTARAAASQRLHPSFITPLDHLTQSPQAQLSVQGRSLRIKFHTNPEVQTWVC